MPFIFRKIHNVAPLPVGTLFAWKPEYFPVADTFSNQNMTVTHTNQGGVAWYTGYADNTLPTDKNTVWEISFTGQPILAGFTINPVVTGASGNFLGNFSQTAGIYLGAGTAGIVYAGGGITKAVGSLGNIVVGDIVAFALNPTLGNIKIFINGSGGSVVFTNLVGDVVRPAVSMYSSYNSSATIYSNNLAYSYAGYEPAGN